MIGGGGGSGGSGGSGTNRFTNNNPDYAKTPAHETNKNNPMAMNYGDSMTENGTKQTMGEYLKAQNEAGGDYVRQKRHQLLLQMP